MRYINESFFKSKCDTQNVICIYSAGELVPGSYITVLFEYKETISLKRNVSRIWQLVTMLHQFYFAVTIITLCFVSFYTHFFVGYTFKMFYYLQRESPIPKSMMVSYWKVGP